MSASWLPMRPVFSYLCSAIITSYLNKKGRASRGPAWFAESNRSSEANPQTEAELPLVDSLPRQIRHAVYHHEIRAIGNGGVPVLRGCEVWGVAEIKRLHAELKFHSLRKLKLTEQAEVPVDDARAAKEVKPACAKTRPGNFCERSGIVKGGARPDSSELRCLGLHLIGLLCTPREI